MLLPKLKGTIFFRILHKFQLQLLQRKLLVSYKVKEDEKLTMCPWALQCSTIWRVPYAIPCTVARYRRANCLSLVSRVKPDTIPFEFGSAIGDLYQKCYISVFIIQIEREEKIDRGRERLPITMKIRQDMYVTGQSSKKWRT